MVHLTRIYTKTGDDGTTSLGDMSRTSKNDPRLEAYATVDEANSYIGVVVSLADAVDREILDVLSFIQNDLFDVGADLCVPIKDNPEEHDLRVTEDQVTRLENYIDLFNKNLKPLSSFVLPTGTPAAAHLHVARTVVRRAERRTWSAISAFGSGVNPLTAKYLNRLSDLLFVLARYSNGELGDILWVPGKTQE
jgi:cob(I)alamin adenosyltransferase